MHENKKIFNWDASVTTTTEPTTQESTRPFRKLEPVVSTTGKYLGNSLMSKINITLNEVVIA